MDCMNILTVIVTHKMSYTVELRNQKGIEEYSRNDNFAYFCATQAAEIIGRLEKRPKYGDPEIRSSREKRTLKQKRDILGCKLREYCRKAIIDQGYGK